MGITLHANIAPNEVWPAAFEPEEFDRRDDEGRLLIDLPDGAYRDWGQRTQAVESAHPHRYRHFGPWMHVLDIHGHRWRVRPAPCGAPCRCACEAVPVDPSTCDECNDLLGDEAHAEVTREHDRLVVHASCMKAGDVVA